MSKVLVGIIANDSARYSLFASCVTNLDTTGIDAKVEWLIGGDWCGARNTLCRTTLEEGYDYLWFMDDDHAFPPGMLKGLLAHNVHLVNPMCCTRTAPFPLVTYAEKVDDKLYLPVNLNGAPEEGLIELEAGGCAGMLIHRQVLEALADPWFEYTDRSEDIVFCEKAKAAGFKLYGDLAQRLGHITTAVVWPAVNEGEWMTGLTIGRDLNLFVSLATDWVEEEVEVEEEITPAELDWEHAEVHEPVVAASPAERIEIWIDDELRWWWRALDHDGVIIQKDSGIDERRVIEAAHRVYPGTSVHQIARELDDSRHPKQFGPPARLWTRG